MYVNDPQPHTIDVSNALKLSVKSARQKYQIILEEEKASKKKDANDNQEQIIVSVIKDIKSKSELLLETCKIISYVHLTLQVPIYEVTLTPIPLFRHLSSQGKRYVFG